MKVKEVEYSRLFNLENFNNERIGFRVAVDDSEDADKVVGELFFKVLLIEEVLELYRKYLSYIYKTESDVEYYENRVREELVHIEDLETRKKRLLEEEEDSKAKMCQLLDIDELLVRARKNLEDYKKKRDSDISMLNTLRKRREKLADLIKAGRFEEALSVSLPCEEDERSKESGVEFV